MSAAGLSRDSLLAPERYAQQRGYYGDSLRAVLDVRRIWVGPDILVTFENRTTLWYQLQEMLFLEQGGEEQLAVDLPAYNALVPAGQELVAALMVEIGEAPRRRRFLARLADQGLQASLQIDGTVVPATTDMGGTRGAAEGRASPVQFLRFALSAEAAAGLAKPGATVSLLVEVGDYRHLVTLSESARQSLAGDLADPESSEAGEPDSATPG